MKPIYRLKFLFDANGECRIWHSYFHASRKRDSDLLNIHSRSLIVILSEFEGLEHWLKYRRLVLIKGGSGICDYKNIEPFIRAMKVC
jgi:hypothetical protein